MFSLPLYAQRLACSEANCPRYAAYMEIAAQAAKAGDYRKALDAYDAAGFAADDCNMECHKLINEQLGTVFESIEKQRRLAQNAQREAEKKNAELQNLMDSLQRTQGELFESQSKILEKMRLLDSTKRILEVALMRARGFIDNVATKEGYAIVGTTDGGFGILDLRGERHFAGELPDRSITPLDTVTGTARAEQYYWRVLPKQAGSGVDSVLECCHSYRIDMRNYKRLLLLDDGKTLNAILRNKEQALYWQQCVEYLRLDDEDFADLDSLGRVAFWRWLPGALRLYRLDLTGAQIDSLPNMAALQDLEELLLANNRLRALPGVEQLPKLRLLDLRRNPYLRQIPEKLASVREFHRDTVAYKVYDAPASLNMANIPSGKFVPGRSGKDDVSSDEYNKTPVEISAFYMSKYEVSIADFARFVEITGYQTAAELKGSSWCRTEKGWEERRGVSWRCDADGNPVADDMQKKYPVIHLTWYDAVEYCNWLSREQGKTPVYTIRRTTDDEQNLNPNDGYKWKVEANWQSNGYRLPTEMEWEYAAGNGSRHTQYAWGNGKPTPKKGGNVADQAAKKRFQGWTVPLPYNDGYATLAPIGSFAPNDFGLYDMTGNVWEWCWDWYDERAYEDFKNYPYKRINPTGAKTGLYRVLRGGAWDLDPIYCRVPFRDYGNPIFRRNNIGFRPIYRP